MATPEQILAVQELLGGEANATENGYTANRIEEMLDAGKSSNTIAAEFWEARYAATAELIDISESGSSRGLSAVTRNARDLAAMYRGKADGEIGSPSPNRSIRSHRMKRV